jgi:hypothetical protein
VRRFSDISELHQFSPKQGDGSSPSCSQGVQSEGAVNLNDEELRSWRNAMKEGET